MKELAIEIDERLNGKSLIVLATRIYIKDKEYDKIVNYWTDQVNSMKEGDTKLIDLLGSELVEKIKAR